MSLCRFSEGKDSSPVFAIPASGVDVRRKGRSEHKSPRTAGWARVHWGHHSCTGRPDGIFQTNGFCQWDSTSQEACSGPRNLPHLLIPGLLCSSSWWAWKIIQETCYVRTYFLKCVFPPPGPGRT